jgi:hypothetical protein
MAYNQGLNVYDFKPSQRKMVDLSALIDEANRREMEAAKANAAILESDQAREIEAGKASDASREAGQTYNYKAKIHPALIAQEAERTSRLKLDNQGIEASLPVLQVAGKKAGIESGFLDKMFQVPKPNLPPYVANQTGPVAQPEPAYQDGSAMANQFAGNSLAELRAMKAEAGPAWEFLGRFIDPMIKARSDAEETGPALQEITAAANMPGSTREQARSKGAALSAVLSKYPAISADPRIKEAIATAMPRNPDVMFSPFQAQGAERSKTQQVIGLENQLRDEYEKGATESRTIARAGQDIAAALKTNNSLSIGTAITKFSKIKDPTTGVLGGEANTTELAAMGDAWNRIQGMAKKTIDGGATPETIRSFEDASRDLMRVQKEIFARVQERTKNRFGSYATRFPDLGLSLNAVMGTEGDRAKEMSMFDAFPEKAEKINLPPDKAARLKELRAKKAAGMLK